MTEPHTTPVAGDLVEVHADATGELVLPEERAQQRLVVLTTSFTRLMVTVYEMWRDEDWKYLRRDDGTPYGGLPELLSDVLGESQAMARRRVQGVRDLYVPLMAMTVDGTQLEITSGDVAALGKGGAREVVARAEEALKDVPDDPDAQSDVIDEIIDEVRRDRAREKQQNHGHDDDPFGADDDFGGGGSGGGGGDRGAGGGKKRGTDGGDEEDFFGGGEYMQPAPPEPAPTPTPRERALARSPFEELISSDQPYDNSERLESLPDDLRAVVEAFQTLTSVPPEQIAAMVSYDNRGVMKHCLDAIGSVVRLRSLVETQDWVLTRL